MPDPVINTDPVPLAALQHWAYCPRQCGLIHLEQAFEDNLHTARGQAVHHLVDTPGYEMKAGVKVERALPLWSDRLGLIGKADLVEFHPDGTVFPVEFKHGPKRQKLYDDLQLAAQAMCLEDMLGRPVPRGAIYHASSHRRREVAITPVLRELVIETANAIRAMLATGQLPAPVNDARCRECSLKEICQPEAMASQNRISGLRESLFSDLD
ncbi:MAG: CRISPR-associated protein Cas4 [Pseudomonadota bacterium]|nr:CRISPR-associated protein Cas4 [Pseudomonadota bacterium]MDP1905067.1 CRISPR-associated protein Cas4 [Pseudomonadota bacterium]MDP2352171.1 CRISPR-associated protein Cas4 [Pseudomonadota bacterium]